MTIQVPLVDSAGVAAALPLRACIDVMADALRAFDRGDAAQPLRSVIRLPDDSGFLYTMPAFLAAPRALAVKLITIFPGNEAGSLPTHQGIVVVFDTHTGVPILLIDAARLTAIRTAAVSALATRTLARPDAAVLTVLGTGVQARSHIQAMQLVRPVREIRIWGRTRPRAEQLAREVLLARDQHPARQVSAHGVSRSDTAPSLSAAAMSAEPAHAPMSVVVCATAQEAVADADIVCAATSAREPILRGAWLRPGVHINATGSSTADAREIDSATVAMARIFVDSIDAALTEAGDLLMPWKEGATDAQSWTPIGAVLNGNAPGRQQDSDVTVFKSVGLAIEDAAAAAHIARQLIPGAEARQ